MAVTIYNYTKEVDIPRLKLEIASSPIVTALDGVSKSGTALTVAFKESLSAGDVSTMDTLVVDHIQSALDQVEEIRDEEGALYVRPKAAKSGRTYHQIYFSFQTSNKESLFQDSYLGQSMNIATLVLFKDDGVGGLTPTTVNEEAIVTQVDFSPSFDYEVIGGQVRIANKPTQNVLVYVVAVPDIPAESGGSLPMVCGANFKFHGLNDPIVADGKVVKNLKYQTEGLADGITNKIRFNIRHHQGATHDILAMMETFH